MLQLTAKLYLPALDEDDVMWSGMPLSPEAMAEKSNVCVSSRLDMPFARSCTEARCHQVRGRPGLE